MSSIAESHKRREATQQAQAQPSQQQKQRDMKVLEQAIRKAIQAEARPILAQASAHQNFVK
jgi:hypothetical protein